MLLRVSADGSADQTCHVLPAPGVNTLAPTLLIKFRPEASTISPPVLVMVLASVISETLLVDCRVMSPAETIDPLRVRLPALTFKDDSGVVLPTVLSVSAAAAPPPSAVVSIVSA